MRTGLFSTSDATFSPCGLYRYSLRRTWHGGLPECVFIMLNPSTADETKDDRTVRRCIDFAQRWGYGSLHVLNIFAFRSTDPDELYTADDPVGPDNDSAICQAARHQFVVAGWGNHGLFLDRGAAVRRMLEGASIHYLALTKYGQPKHPLYISGDVTPVPLPRI